MLVGGIALFFLAGIIADIIISALFGGIPSVLAFITAQLVGLIAFKVIVSSLNRREVFEPMPPGIRESRVRQGQATLAIFLFITGGVLVSELLSIIVPGLPHLANFIAAQVLGLISVQILFRGFGINRRFPVVE